MQFKLLRYLQSNRRSGPAKDPSAFLSKLRRRPLDPKDHFELAKRYFDIGDYSLAHAEFLTAQYLGLAHEGDTGWLEKIKSRLPEMGSISHNLHFRCCSVADEIKDLNGEGGGSVLDVGGGHGQLAQFLPGFEYCLADPASNAISGTDLPFEKASFDFVVSCHVLEHIPPLDREKFLDELLTRARKALILLNPFNVADTRVTERLQLIVEITGADWAREHLQCSLPDIDFIKQFVNARGLQCSIKPNGTMAMTLALVFMEHFATKAEANLQSKMIMTYLNSLPSGLLHSEAQPNAYLVVIQRKDVEVAPAGHNFE